MEQTDKQIQYSCVMTIHNCFQFHKIPLNDFLVMAKFVDFRAIQGQ